MKTTLALLLSLSLLYSATADEAASRKYAAQILEVAKAENAMKSAFTTTIDSMIANMKRQGMPDAAAVEMSDAVHKWFDAEVKWADLQPKMVDLYVAQFSETELKELLAFYQTPTGQKTIEKLPVIMAEGAKIGQSYVGGKEEGLKTIVQGIIEKHRPKPAK